MLERIFIILDQLRQSIGLRAYGQRDPLNEYKKEAFNLFEEMLSKIDIWYINFTSFEINDKLSKKPEEKINSNNFKVPVVWAKV